MVLIELATVVLIANAATTAAAGAGLSVVQIVFTALAPSGIATLLTALYMRRKIKAETSHTDADAVQILTNTSVSLLEPMQQQISFLTGQLTEANLKIMELNLTVKGLNDRLDRYQELHGDLPPMV